MKPEIANKRKKRIVNNAQLRVDDRMKLLRKERKIKL